MAKRLFIILGVIFVWLVVGIFAQEPGVIRDKEIIDKQNEKEKTDSLDSEVEVQDSLQDSTAIVDTTKAPEVLHNYISSRNCRICHKDQYDSWLQSKHAKTMINLTNEEKRDPKCQECHTTGITIKNVLLENVQCEACHGAGTDYKKANIMKDKKLAMENGLLEPKKEVCEKCHNDRSPTFKGFDYDEAIKNFSEIHQHFPPKLKKE